MWFVTAMCIMYGVKWMGRIAYVTSTVPYVIILVLLVRGVTLPGARLGLDYYLLQPQLGKIFTMKAWKDASSQICYSLSIGFGGLLALSSYNPRTHNCYRWVLRLQKDRSEML